MKPQRTHLLLYAIVAVAALIAMGNTPAQAVPLLQLYLEGGTYDETTESWLLTPPGSSGGAPFRLWTIGNIGGPGGTGTIEDVRLSAVYDTAVGDIVITITPSTTEGYNGFFDPSTPDPVEHLQTVYDGSTPILGTGKPLPKHGEYGSGRTWQEFLLGDFSLEDSPLANFDGSTNSPSPDDLTGVAQINVYEISVAPAPGTEFGIHPFTIHFDLYNHVESGNHIRSVFTPFSHDGEGEGGGPDGTVTIVPEPSSALLFMAGAVVGLTFISRKPLGMKVR